MEFANAVQCGGGLQCEGEAHFQNIGVGGDLKGKEPTLWCIDCEDGLLTGDRVDDSIAVGQGEELQLAVMTWSTVQCSPFFLSRGKKCAACMRKRASLDGCVQIKAFEDVEQDVIWKCTDSIFTLQQPDTIVNRPACQFRFHGGSGAGTAASIVEERKASIWILFAVGFSSSAGGVWKLCEKRDGVKGNPDCSVRWAEQAQGLTWTIM
nr:unnamed protein product [Digitaria exilis]